MNIKDFGPLKLSKFSHDSPSDGMCVMEMVSFLAGEEWSDNPPCSSPVVSRFCQVINDKFRQDVRDKLQSYVPRLIGTASPSHDIERAEYLAWSAIRIFAPIALRARGSNNWADKLESFSGTFAEARLVCLDASRAVESVSTAASSSTAAAAYAAYAAADASKVAGKVAGKAAGKAAGKGAGKAAGKAAGNAAPIGLDGKVAVFKVLDGLLDIGPSGEHYTQDHLSRIEPLRKAVLASA